MRHFSARVASNAEIALGTWEMAFEWKDESIPLAGSFFTVKGFPGTDPLLRRPFAFSGFDGETSLASFIYLKRGKATSILSSLAPGAIIDVLGRLGKPFPAPETEAPSLLVAGGIGLGPLLFLANSLSDSSKPFSFVYGARHKDLVPANRLPGNAVVMTDDGSLGRKGTTADAAAALIDKAGEDGIRRIYACGPGPMLGAIARLAQTRGIPCSVSVEQHMACGVGACMGCSVPLRKGGFARACAEGPVFDASELSWEA